MERTIPPNTWKVGRGYNTSQYINTITHLAEFYSTTEILTVDTTYSDYEIQTKRGWGHFCISALRELSEELQKTKIYLFHLVKNKTDLGVERDSAALRSKNDNIFIARQGEETLDQTWKSGSLAFMEI